MNAPLGKRLPPAIAASIARSTALVAAQQRARAKSGDAAEDLLAAYHAVALARGVAAVRKLPTPTRRIGQARGGFRAVYAARSGVDYVGVMLDGSGRAVFLEAKRCAAGRLPLARVEPQQREELDRALGAGAVAALVVVHGPRHAVHVVPWAHARERVSLGALELAPYAVTAATYLTRFVRLEAPGV